MPPRKFIKPAQSEEGLLRQVVQLARLMGWRINHQRPALTGRGWKTAIQGDVGFPDLVLIRPPRLLFVELKTDKGDWRPGQREWIADAAASGAEAYCWRPKDFDEIVAKLAR